MPESYLKRPGSTTKEVLAHMKQLEYRFFIGKYFRIPVFFA
jgi:hypothetical protein